MSAQFVSRPDITRHDVGIVKVSTWDTGTPERQSSAVEAIRAAWCGRPWPHRGLRSYTVHTGDDGTTLLHYSQWNDEAAYQESVQEGRDQRNADIDRAVPGIERLAPATFELYRSSGPDAGEGPEPGCVVIVDVAFEGPDKARQRDWVDAVFEALGTDPALPPGALAGHFHASLDGTRVLNYAEWVSAQAHIDALSAAGNGIGSATPQWKRVHEHPGMRSSGVNRYTPALSMMPGADV